MIDLPQLAVAATVVTLASASPYPLCLGVANNAVVAAQHLGYARKDK